MRRCSIAIGGPSTKKKVSHDLNPDQNNKPMTGTRLMETLE